jgi:hypothetical protein
MRKRSALHCERLEQRELPANSFSAVVLPLDLAPTAHQDAPASHYRLADAPSAQSFEQSAEQARLSSDAVGAFFADQVALGGLFDLGTDWEASTASAPGRGLTSSDEAEFWSFLRNYASKAIRREEIVRGPLPDHADIIQQIYVEWRQEVPSGDEAHVRLLDRDSAERTVFRTAVRRVLDRTRYDEVKQRRRADMTDHEARDNAPARDWADLEIDLAHGVGQLTGRQRDILDMRRWGLTFEEIGTKLGLPRQRVFETYTDVVDRLSALYCD